MSGQRKKGKRSISFWPTEEERKILEEAAKRLGKNKSDLLKMAVAEVAARLGIENPEPPQEQRNEDHD